MLIPVTIDGQIIEVEKGTNLLEAARRLGLRIPTLCYHEALEPYGACRLCQVEVVSRGRSRVRTACEYPVLREGEVVHTHSEPVLKIRRLVVELLLARCPDVPILRELADELGMREVRFRTLGEPSQCILCGLCVRVCNEVLGCNAISFAGRGVGRRVSTPYAVNSERCIGCGACAQVCPTGVIRLRERDGKLQLRFWNTELELAACPSCGVRFAPGAALLAAREKAPDLEDLLSLCPKCRGQQARNHVTIGVECVS
jgi:bidirectional [NiFe] hydrogenase diaphorase subunit